MIDQATAMSPSHRGKPRASDPFRQVRRIGICAALVMLGAVGGIAPAQAGPLACDDGLKSIGSRIFVGMEGKVRDFCMTGSSPNRESGRLL